MQQPHAMHSHGPHAHSHRWPCARSPCARRIAAASPSQAIAHCGACCARASARRTRAIARSARSPALDVRASHCSLCARHRSLGARHRSLCARATLGAALVARELALAAREAAPSCARQCALWRSSLAAHTRLPWLAFRPCPFVHSSWPTTQGRAAALCSCTMPLLDAFVPHGRRAPLLVVSCPHYTTPLKGNT